MLRTYSYRLVRVTLDETSHKHREDGRTVLRSAGRVKKELLWESEAPLPDNPQLEFFVELGVLVEKEDALQEVDVLDAIEGSEQLVHTYELEVCVAKGADRWSLVKVFGSVHSNVEPLEELECDNDPGEVIGVEGSPCAIRVGK